MKTSHPQDFGFRGTFSTEESFRARYSGATGILSALPDAVAIPSDQRDVCALLTWATETCIPVVPRAAATGMPGGNVGTGVVLDMTGFNAPPRIDPSSHTADAEPGVTLAQLNQASAPFNLHFPVDPSSGYRCTLGGMLANNAAGAHSVRYGSTRPWVRGLDMVLADGTPVTLKRGEAPPEPLSSRLAELAKRLQLHRDVIASQWPLVRKNSSGYALREYLRSDDPIDLLVGSEGTLGIFTRAVLDLAPLPASVGLIVLEFDSLEAATEAVLHLLPLDPLTCEMLDRTFLDLVRRGGGDDVYPLRPGLEALLLVEFEASSRDQLELSLAKALSATSAFAKRAVPETAAARVARIWEIRHAASPIIAREAGSRVSMQFIEDSVVPVEHLSAYIRGLRQILLRFDLPAVIFGHAGDGNLHVNPLVDVQDSRWRKTLEQVLLEVTDLVISLGGTLAGEHGDGRLRAPLLQKVWGEPLFACFQMVKSTFDPAGILNPGVVIPLPHQDPLALLREFA